MRFIIFSAAAIRQAESNLFNVDVLYRESSLDEFRVEPMKSAPATKGNSNYRLNPPAMAYSGTLILSPRYKFIKYKKNSFDYKITDYRLLKKNR